MKSLQIKKIDGFDVVVGFQNRPIDPVATQNKNRKAAFDLPESVELRSKNDIQNGYRVRLMEALKNAKAFKKMAAAVNLGIVIGDPKKTNEAESAKWSKIANDLTGVMNTINEELKVLSVACKSACEKILTDNPVYNDQVEFTTQDENGNDVVNLAGPRAGEVIKTKAEIDDLTQKFKDKPDETQLLVDGEYKPDFRGKIFHYKDDEMTNGKWTKGAIDSLGDKLEIGKFEEDLTSSEKTEIAEQENTDRIAGMTAGDKTTEYKGKKTGLAGQAQTMEIGLKFDGDVDFQSKAQTFYNTELDKLKLEYGVA